MGDEQYIFYAAVDTVVFSVIGGELNVLLITNKFPPFQNRFALPGGRVGKDEEFEDAAARELFEETGIKNIFLKKFNAYGKIGRDPRNRVISMAFLAFIDSEKFTIEAKSDALTVEWAPVQEIKELSYDHDQILADALDELRLDIQTTNIAAQLLPEKFTLTQLQQVYESVLNRKLDKRNFRKKITELAILKETSEMSRSGAHRPAKLYTFKQREYQPLKEKMHIFV